MCDAEKEILKVSDVSKKYPNDAGIFDVSLSIDSYGIYGLLGENGAGKSTLMSIITGYMKPDKGEVLILGNNIFKEAVKAKENIGYLPELPPLYDDLTVKEYLRFVAKLKGIKKAYLDNTVGETIEKCGLTEMKDRLNKNLSKGYRQRVGLAQAIISDAKLIVLDEPINGLDPAQIAETRKLILSLKEERAVILSSHILSEIEDVCEKIFIISKGRLVFDGLLDELETEGKSLENAFLDIISSPEAETENEATEEVGEDNKEENDNNNDKEKLEETKDVNTNDSDI